MKYLHKDDQSGEVREYKSKAYKDLIKRYIPCAKIESIEIDLHLKAAKISYKAFICTNKNINEIACEFIDLSKFSISYDGSSVFKIEDYKYISTDGFYIIKKIKQ